MASHPHDSYGFMYTSSINRLPVELISYIFILGTYTPEVSDAADIERCMAFTTESIKMPLTLSSVNHHWRTIARNTPCLWTSLCVTVEMVQDLDLDPNGQKRTTLNVRHLISYLSLSRNYPIDIIIDARDQDWDFSEPETPADYELNTYTPPFPAAHMSKAISIVLPHLRRWRSIDILTDSWAPMYTALRQIQAEITVFGAPLLESLTLMRCNDFVSYSPAFQPHDMKGPSFLNFADHPSSRQKNLLPRLTNLTLRGVHVDWSSLACILSHSQTGLRILELSSHCLEVRPTFLELHQLLSTSPHLQKLLISGSGPFTPEDMSECTSIPRDGFVAVSLPELQDITIGYRSAIEGQIILELLAAQNVKSLTLEDATYPGEPEDVDACGILTFLGTGEDHPPNQGFVTYSVPDVSHCQVAINRVSSAFVAHGEDAIRLDDGFSSQAPFPLLESVTLRGVKARPQSFRAFFSALQNLQRLELGEMSMQAIDALLPGTQSPRATRALVTCPCPQLQSLCIKGFDSLKVQDFDFIVGGLAVERMNKGACGLKEVDIHVDSMTACYVEDVIVVSNGILGTTVKIFRGTGRNLHAEEWVSKVDIDPFKNGGAFNDPIFDEYYAGRAVLR